MYEAIGRNYNKLQKVNIWTRTLQEHNFQLLNMLAILYLVVQLHITFSILIANLLVGKITNNYPRDPRNLWNLNFFFFFTVAEFFLSTNNDML